MEQGTDFVMTRLRSKLSDKDRKGLEEAEKLREEGLRGSRSPRR